MASTTAEVKPTTVNIGADVLGVDLKSGNPEDSALVRDALLKHHVVFVRNQFLNERQLTDFASSLGEIAPPPPNFDPDSMTPDGQYLLDSAVTRANEWHTDQTYVHAPVWLGILSAEILPEVGGDTTWSNMSSVYQMLSDPMKEMLRGLQAEHGPQAGKKEDIRTAHPVIAARPFTDEPVVYVNPSFTRRIIGLNEPESRHTLNALYEIATGTPEIQVRHRWSPGDLVLWDMRSTLHRAIDDFGSAARILRRISVLGPTPVSVDGVPSRSFAGDSNLAPASM